MTLLRGKCPSVVLLLPHLDVGIAIQAKVRPHALRDDVSEAHRLTLGAAGFLEWRRRPLACVISGSQMLHYFFKFGAYFAAT